MVLDVNLLLNTTKNKNIYSNNNENITKMKNNEAITIADNVYGYDELVDATVASKIIGLAPRTIRNMVVRRDLPIYRISRNVTKYLVRDLIEWSENKRIDV